MSTNYYMRKTCAHCDGKREIHVGLWSAGWPFQFEGYDYRHPLPGQPGRFIMSSAHWAALMNDLIADGWKLVDEYDKEESVEKFWKDAYESVSVEKVAKARREMSDWVSTKDGTTFIDASGFIMHFQEFC